MGASNVSTTLIGLVTLIYFTIAGSALLDGNKPLALVYAAYGIGNLGIMWGMK